MKALAVKRCGFVLETRFDGSTTDDIAGALSWLEAGAVADRLNQSRSEDFANRHRDALNSVIGCGNHIPAEGIPYDPNVGSNTFRGQIFHSDYLKFELGQFLVYASFTYTVCVKYPKILPIDGNVQGADIAYRKLRSKFWYSAILFSKDLENGENELISRSAQIDELAKSVLDATLPTYQENMGKHKPGIIVEPNENTRMSELLVQTDDQQLEESIDRIVEDGVPISEKSLGPSISLLDNMFASKDSKLLHVQRGDLTTSSRDCSVNVDTLIETSPNKSRAYYIETQKVCPDSVGGDFENFSLGVVSDWAASLDDFDPEKNVADLARTAAGKISAKRVAALGELF